MIGRGEEADESGGDGDGFGVGFCGRLLVRGFRYQQMRAEGGDDRLLMMLRSFSEAYPMRMGHNYLLEAYFTGLPYSPKPQMTFTFLR